jgi:hypothetical protein
VIHVFGNGPQETHVTDTAPRRLISSTPIDRASTAASAIASARIQAWSPSTHTPPQKDTDDFAEIGEKSAPMRPTATITERVTIEFAAALLDGGEPSVKKNTVPNARMGRLENAMAPALA